MTISTRLAMASVVMLAATAATLAHVSVAQPTHRTIAFGNGKVSVTIPAYYESSFGKTGTLQLIEVPNHSVRFYLDHHDATGVGGQNAVRLIAAKKGIPVKDIGPRHTMSIDHGSNSKQGGKDVQNVHRAIGFDNSIVIFSTAIEVGKLESPVVKRFIDTDMDIIVQSLATPNKKN